MKPEEIVKFLQSLGMSEYEAKTYAALSTSDSMKAGELSKKSGVPQSKVYWVLEDLIEKQLVEVSEGKPKEYRVVPADIGLKRMVEEKERSIVSVKSGLKEVSRYLKPTKGSETSTGIWTVKGRNWVEFFNKASDMIGKSRKYVYGVTRDFSRSAKLSQVVQAAAKRGVKVRVLGMQEIDEENYLKAKWFIEHGAELKTIEANLHPRIVIVDGKEVLLRLDHDQTKKEDFPFSSVWSEDPGLVRVFDTYVKNVWDSAKPLDMKALERRMIG
jgi:sugar-specific transcriptional regulator TrmB